MTRPAAKLATAMLVLALLAAGAMRASADDRAYAVKISGEMSVALRKELEQASVLVAERDTPPVSQIGLRRRIFKDLDRFDTVLRAEGYYGATIREHVDDSVSPVVVELSVTTGPLYRVRGVAIVLTDASPDADAAEIVDGLEPFDAGAPARASDVVAYGGAALAKLVAQGFRRARIVDRHWEVDHRERVLWGTIEVEAGTRARFGATEFEGLEGIEEHYARSLMRWKRGDWYTPSRIEASRKTFLATRLFESVRIVGGEPNAESDEVPVTVSVVERPFRSIGFGVEYDSVDGAGGTAFWEHRNLGGAGRRLRLSGSGGELELQGRAAYRHPLFFRDDQTFLADAAYTVEDTEAYKSSKVTTSVAVERALTRRLSARAGLLFEYGPVEAEAVEDGTDGHKQTFTLVGVPLALRYDGSDSVLEPTNGGRVDLESIPYLQALGSDLTFSVNRATMRGYLPVGERERLILAARVSAGTILGSSRSGIPVDKRFYAGGGGSVRGYKYQTAGPLEPDAGDPDKLRPVGGRSLLEAGGELRWRLTPSFGLVAFLDGGTVYEDPAPDLSERFYLGSGLGGRYYTGIGPIRLDVATPIDRRDNDDLIQVYISIGETY
jgi:translocation and assembly module TamA